MHLSQFLATTILVSHSIFAFPCTHSPPRRIHHRSDTPPSATSLDPWIGTLYNGLNSIRLTSITDTPLRLRQTLNDVAQAKANQMCAGNKQTDLALADFGVNVEDTQLLVLENEASAESVIERWAADGSGKGSPLSDIMNPFFVYVGVGMCKDQWAVVLTSEFI